ncbi:MAG: SagB family peptide dehydrogenase, partial [Actinomycetota bacterium]
MPSEPDPGSAARAFHLATRHSPESIRRLRHYLDWENYPNLFKVYEGTDRIPLPPATQMERAGGAAGLEAPDLPGLARLLLLGAGVIRKRTYADGKTFYFRTYASAGALYPVEVYLACEELEGLAAGVYHFDPKGRALIPLRTGDHRGHLVRAGGHEPSLSSAPVILALTGIPGRTGWKYTERGYRHLFWDAGMILANLLALASSVGLTARVILSFVDAKVERLLGLDGAKEFPLCLLALGADGSSSAEGIDPPLLTLRSAATSRREVAFEAVTMVNDAGRLADPEAVAAWRERETGLPSAAGAERIPPVAPTEPIESIERVIGRRGSARAFGRGAIPAEVLSSILGNATRGVPTDLQPGGDRLTEVFLIANAVGGLEPGAYVFQAGGFRLLRQGKMREEAGHLCLDQELGAAAASTHFLMV